MRHGARALGSVLVWLFPDMLIGHRLQPSGDLTTICNVFRRFGLYLVSGQHHIVALGKDSTVYTLGRGEMGQLGVMNEAGTGPQSETDS